MLIKSIAYQTYADAGKTPPEGMPSDYPLKKRIATTVEQVQSYETGGWSIVEIHDDRDEWQQLLDSFNDHPYFVAQRAAAAKEEALQAARIETRRRVQVGADLNFELNAQLRSLGLNNSDSVTVAAVAGPVQALINSGSFTTALSTLQAAELSIPASAKTAYDFAVAELQKLVNEFDGGA